MGEHSVNSLHVRLSLAESQLKRMVSDAESEKGTRGRIHKELNDRINALESDQRKVERMLYAGIGILGVVQVIVVPLIIAWLFHK